MNRLAMLWLLALVPMVQSCTHKNMTPDTESIGSIVGHVTIGPLRPGPVHVDEKEPEVPPELYASHQIIVLSEDGKTKVAETKIDSKGNYKVDVPPGTYQIDVQPHDIGFGNFVPQQVLVEAGKTVTHNIDIDTGMR